MAVTEDIRPQTQSALRQAKTLINGSWVDSMSSRTLTVENPAWSKVAPRDRGRILQRIADKMEAEAEDMARLIALETGNALRTHVGIYRTSWPKEDDVRRPARWVDYRQGDGGRSERQGHETLRLEFERDYSSGSAVV